MGLGIRTTLDRWGRLWRSAYASRFLVVSIGPDCDLRPGCEIECGRPSRGQNYRGISLGKGITLCRGVVLTTDSYLPESGITIGDGTSINRNTLVQGSGEVNIGKNVLIGPSVIIWSSGHKIDSPPDGPIKGQGLTFGTITIEDDAWIGAGSIILQGVTIGAGAVVGAGSVVKKDVPPGEIVAGNPAVSIGRRGER